jgi:hypothetical protein
MTKKKEVILKTKNQVAEVAEVVAELKSTREEDDNWLTRP